MLGCCGTIYRQYRQWIKPSLNENYRRGVRHNDRGANHNARLLWYGVNPNDKTVMINPPGAYHNGGLMKTLPRSKRVLNSKLKAAPRRDFPQVPLTGLPLRRC